MNVPGSTTPSTLLELIHLHSDRNPNAVALLASGQQPCTYGQLAELVERVGKNLRAIGVGRGDRVAVILPNGPEMAAAFLGIAANATCAPLNPAYRAEEIEFYLKDLQAKAVIVPADVETPAIEVAERLGVTIVELDSSVSPVAGDFQLRPLRNDGETSPDNALADGALADGALADDVALVLHTSGTTSRPKQVPLSQQNLCASASNIVEVLGLSTTDRCLNVMPLFHIHGLIGVLLSSIRAGASVVCSAGFSAETFGQLMREFEPTWYSAVPTIHQSILALAKTDSTLAADSRLRLIRSSSSALPPSVMDELEQAFSVPVIESYGMTEATHQMASNPLPPAQRKPGSVGLPAGPEMAIADDAGKLLEAEQVGEIVIRGRNVTTGYVNNPEANEASFTDGWFRTGDLGRTDADGYFFITGRKKEMINRGGENISPREIDEALLQHPAVAQAVAFAVPHPTLGEDLCAAVVLEAANTTNENELRRFASSQLAQHKVPTRILTVGAIPKGPTGKLQRIGLHEQLADELAVIFVEPRTDLERSIVAAIEQVLETDRIGVTDNFFALGGDSLKATRVLTKLRSEFQIAIPVSSLFLNPTAEELSIEVLRLLGEDAGDLEELLAELEGMSDDEAREQLE